MGLRLYISSIERAVLGTLGRLGGVHIFDVVTSRLDCGRFMGRLEFARELGSKSGGVTLFRRVLG